MIFASFFFTSPLIQYLYLNVLPGDLIKKIPKFKINKFGTAKVWLWSIMFLWRHCILTLWRQNSTRSEWFFLRGELQSECSLIPKREEEFQRRSSNPRRGHNLAAEKENKQIMTKKTKKLDRKYINKSFRFNNFRLNFDSTKLTSRQFHSIAIATVPES